jgi:phosphatidylserine decarboxylase
LVQHKTPLIAKAGIPYILTGLIAAVLAGFFSGWLAIVLGLLTCFVIWFFRDPERNIPTGAGLIVAPADGKIVQIREEQEERFLKSRAIRISIFLNIFDVHVNRIPCAGKIRGMVYHAGKFLAAHLDKASFENEHQAILIEAPTGERVVVVQIAGLIARRIVSWIQPGDRVERGERFGMIRFGSRVDIFLPLGTKLKVQPGERVKGGETTIGEFNQ